MDSEEVLYEFLRTHILPISAVKDGKSVDRFVKAGGITILIELLDHKNTEISIKCALQALKELTEEDVSAAD